MEISLLDEQDLLINDPTTWVNNRLALLQPNLVDGVLSRAAPTDEGNISEFDNIAGLVQQLQTDPGPVVAARLAIVNQAIIDTQAEIAELELEDPQQDGTQDLIDELNLILGT